MKIPIERVQLAPRPTLLILTSTYPRWSQDPEPGFVHELAKRLTTEFDTHVLCPHAPGSLRLEIIDNVAIHRYRYAPERLQTLVQGGGILANLRNHRWKWLLVLPFLIAQLLATRRLIQSLKPDVLHAHWLVPQGVIIALAGRLGTSLPPVLLTSHGADLFSLRGRLLTHVKRLSLRCIDQMTVVSRAMVTPALDLGAHGERLNVIPMGVDFEDRFVPSATTRRSNSELLFVGRLVEKKGLRILLEAFPRIQAKRPDVTLTIVGYGPEESRLRAIIRELDLEESVQFTGAIAQDALPHFYQRAALLIAPFITARDGDQEGLGLVVVEAIACECPVLVSELPAVLDVLDPSKDSEFLVASGDAVALSEKVLHLLKQQEGINEKIKKLRYQLIKTISWPAVSERYSRSLTDTMRRRDE